MEANTDTPGNLGDCAEWTVPCELAQGVGFARMYFQKLKAACLQGELP
jgi:hypothetical protein